MSESLFHMPEADDQSTGPERSYPITEAQVQQIRAEFDRLNITSMDDRKAIVDNMSRRQVSRLTELTALEARRVLADLIRRTVDPQPSSGSSWDTRSEDTWIDKL